MSCDAGLPSYSADRDLPPEALAEFQRLGVVRLSGAFTPAHAERCRALVWRRLAEAGVARDDPATWGGLHPSHIKSLARHPEFAFAALPRVSAALDRLIGPQRHTPASGGAFFLTAPTPPQEAWAIPRRTWHWDGRVDLAPGASVALHALLAPLGTRCGGTLYVMGSHRLVRRLHEELPTGARHGPNKAQRKRFRERHAWFAALERDEPPGSDELVAGMMERSFAAEGQELRIVDVHGEAGDVVIAAAFMIHSAPVRVGPGPRLVHVCGVDAAAP